MSGYDIFAWIVLLILVASSIGVFCIAGWLPGHIAKSPGRFHRRGRHLHRTSQTNPRGPARDPASDRDFELREPVLNEDSRTGARMEPLL
jgi:hypothetical protein